MMQKISTTEVVTAVAAACKKYSGSQTEKSPCVAVPDWLNKAWTGGATTGSVRRELPDWTGGATTGSGRSGRCELPAWTGGT